MVQLIFRPDKTRTSSFSIIFLLSILFLFLIISLMIPSGNLHIILILWILFLFICLVFVVNFYSLDKLGYIISEKSLIIKWGFLRKEIPFDTIKKVTITPMAYFQGIRLGGFRYPGYHVGLFEILMEGTPIKITLYATNLKSLITIMMKKGEKTKYYGLTPKNPNKFIEELNIRRRRYQFNIEERFRSHNTEYF